MQLLDDLDLETIIGLGRYPCRSHQPNYVLLSLSLRAGMEALSIKATKNSEPPATPPIIADVVTWIARLGGYLARKGDGPPGTIALWRGWKRLTDLAEGWTLAVQS